MNLRSRTVKPAGDGHGGESAFHRVSSPLPLLLSVALTTPVVQAQDLVVTTFCRVGGGAWQACRLAVQDPGLRWQVQLGQQVWSFSHNGSGAVRLRQGQGAWKVATPRWERAGEVLCWGQLCARGPLPLD
jgi:hypothetical protein